MKKIYLNGRFLTQSITGVQRVAYQLITALDDLLAAGKLEKQETFEFILVYSGELINDIQLKHIKIVKKGLLKGNLWEQLELPLYTAGHTLVSLCSISTLFKRNQLVIVHDASFAVNSQFFTFLFRNWYKFAIRFLGLTIRQILTVSQFSKSELATHAGIPLKKISVLPNSGDHVLRFGDPSIQFQEMIEQSKPYCLAVSSLGANKNFNGLSKAIAKADLARHRMLIAGGVAKTLKTNLSGTEQVRYMGYVCDAELKYLYAHADLFIFPSFYEGFGIPPLEAMSLGCPVLASNTSSLPEVLGDACNYCNPFDENDMATKISELIKSPVQRMTLRNKGYEQAAKYNWHDSAGKFFKLICKFSK